MFRLCQTYFQSDSVSDTKSLQLKHVRHQFKPENIPTSHVPFWPGSGLVMADGDCQADEACLLPTVHVLSRLMSPISDPEGPFPRGCNQDKPVPF